MKKFFLLVSFLLLFFSCSNGNVFSNFDKPNTEKISWFTGQKLLDSLEENINSKMFFDFLNQTQRERILDSLDTMISIGRDANTVNSNSTSSRAALLAVELIIRSDPLVYSVIYDFTDPILTYISDANATLESVFAVFTTPIQNVAKESGCNAETQISNCFYDMFRIANYYDLAATTSRYGNYSGGDLQKYIISAVVSGIIYGTQEALDSTSGSVQELSSLIGQIYVELQQSSEQVESNIEDIFHQIKIKLGVAGADISNAYREQFWNRATILEDIAFYAGFETMAKITSDVLRRWSRVSD